MSAFLYKWVWERSAFLLGTCVLAALIAGWNLPDTKEIVVVLAYAQIILAIIVVVREGRAIFR
jgi:hypothetical protein